MAASAVLPDGRSPEQRRTALARARGSDGARALLARALSSLDAALTAAEDAGGQHAAPLWDHLSTAYDHLDAYLERLAKEADLQVSCGPRCSACCTDAPPTLAIEGLRLCRALRRRSDAKTRLQRAVTYARRFQSMLLGRTDGTPTQADISSELYRTTQMEWRRLGLPCPALLDDGNCSVHEHRPLACRIHLSIEDPARCAPAHPAFLKAEHPQIWGDPREAELELRLMAIGRALDLPSTPNLPWALAALHEHPLAQPERASPTRDRGSRRRRRRTPCS
jgi:Fe-S-cluster containining protein